MGQKAPPIDLKTPCGKPFKLDGPREKPLLVIFIRGTWCPNCRKQMESLQAAKDRFQQEGLDVWVIAAQKPGFPADPKQYLDENPVFFPLLLDQDREVTRRYGVYHLFGLDAYNIARPAAFLVAPDGHIEFIFVSSNQVERVSIDDVFRALSRMRQPT